MNIDKFNKKKQAILDAAITVFIEKGFKEATMREIAAAANLTTGALYHHFTNKEELFYHAVKEAMYFTRNLSEMDENQQRKSSTNMLNEIVFNVRERMSKVDEQRLLVLITGYILSQGGATLEDLRNEYIKKIDKVADMYFYAFSIDNPAFKKGLSSILIAALDGIAIQYSIGALSQEDQEFKETFISFFIESIPAYLKKHMNTANESVI